MRRDLSTVLLFATLAVAFASRASAQPFVLPIGGEEGSDWSIVEYFDLQTGAGKRDFRGGSFTANENQGLDFLIPNFVAMDAGVPVFAAEAGTVVTAVDGRDDRFINKKLATDDGNLITIRHGQGVQTTYKHLKNGSILVEAGDVVTRGQEIAEVGSSGPSYWPHLYFEVRRSGAPFETLLQPSVWWGGNEPGYTGDFLSLLDSGIVDDEPTRREYANRPEDVTTFFRDDPTNPRRQIVLWAMVTGLGSGQRFDFRVLRPDGTTYSSQSFGSVALRWGFVDVGAPFPRNAPLGTWTAELRLDEEIFVRRTFRVVRGSGAPAGESADDVAASAPEDEAVAFSAEKPGPRFVDGRSLGPTASYQAGAAAEAAGRWRGADPDDALAVSSHLAASYAAYVDDAASALTEGDAELYAELRARQGEYSFQAYLDAEAAAANSQDPAAFAAALDAYLAYAYAYYDR